MKKHKKHRVQKILGLLFISFAAIILLGIPTPAHAAKQLTLRWLSDLPPSAIEEIALGNLPETLESYQSQEVYVRGFLYTTKEGKLLLAAEPNLKSCCIASKEHVLRQIMITNPIGTFSNYSSAITLQGQFKVNPIKDKQGHWQQLFLLDKAHLLKPNEEINQMFFYLLFAIVASISSFYFWLRIVKK